MQDKVAIVTGAASGIGKAAAIRLAAEGAKVSLIDKNEQTITQTEAEIKNAGGEAITFIADTANPEEISRAVKKTAEQWGSIHTVFANAGILGMTSPIEYFPTEEWAGTISNNLVGTFETVLEKQGIIIDKNGYIVYIIYIH
ncbi:short chain dehydrogenase [Paenibacillus sophorae]|uniref:SDR family NAD(P)-dependent oxidoreductase n=1 Tax=Paenibacillus sophorae TaxID=1333845 RepID=A0A1H8FLP1_9BACL|nr:SDR family NAD(P)-dependent oxidoreductase [Paenibacillus sophorae]QWU13897.1 SDR family NAD(P)-dependent oxidoreductase [Paenibacillus sophorae]SEN32087.1 short chain dehydrogenase [Paenibacillus sophorae]